MTNIYAVTFDIADGSFMFYSKESWNIQIEEWREELVENEYVEDGQELDHQEIVEMLWGEEMFVDFITPGSVK
jgi:hypothetical protein